MSCQGCFLSYYVEHPRIQNKFLNVTKHGVIVRLYKGKRDLIRPTLAREGLGSTYSSTPKRCVHGQCSLPDASWCQYYAEKPHLHTPCYLPFSITKYESILLTGGYLYFSSNVDSGARFTGVSWEYQLPSLQTPWTMKLQPLWLEEETLDTMGSFQDCLFMHTSSTLKEWLKGRASLGVFARVPTHGLINMGPKDSQPVYMVMQCFKRWGGAVLRGNVQKTIIPKVQVEVARLFYVGGGGGGVTSAKSYWSKQSKACPDSRGGNKDSTSSWEECQSIFGH